MDPLICSGTELCARGDTVPDGVRFSQHRQFEEGKFERRQPDGKSRGTDLPARGRPGLTLREAVDAATNWPVAVLLRPGKTPSGDEIRDSRMVAVLSR